MARRSMSGPGNRRDAHRHLLQRLLDAGRGNDHRLVERGQPQGDGRQLHRIGGDLDAAHRHLAEPAQEDRHRVDAGGNGERETARGVGHRGARTHRAAEQRDGRTGQHGAGRVDDRAGEPPLLRGGGRRRGNYQTEDDRGRQCVAKHGAPLGNRRCGRRRAPGAEPGIVTTRSPLTDTFVVSRIRGSERSPRAAPRPRAAGCAGRTRRHRILPARAIPDVRGRVARAGHGNTIRIAPHAFPTEHGAGQRQRDAARKESRRWLT